MGIWFCDGDAVMACHVQSGRAEECSANKASIDQASNGRHRSAWADRAAMKRDWTGAMDGQCGDSDHSRNRRHYYGIMFGMLMCQNLRSRTTLESSATVSLKGGKLTRKYLFACSLKDGRKFMAERVKQIGMTENARPGICDIRMGPSLRRAGICADLSGL